MTQIESRGAPPPVGVHLPPPASPCYINGGQCIMRRQRILATKSKSRTWPDQWPGSHPIMTSERDILSLVADGKLHDLWGDRYRSHITSHLSMRLRPVVCWRPMGWQSVLSCRPVSPVTGTSTTQSSLRRPLKSSQGGPHPAGTQLLRSHTFIFINGGQSCVNGDDSPPSNLKPPATSPSSSSIGLDLCTSRPARWIDSGGYRGKTSGSPDKSEGESRVNLLEATCPPMNGSGKSDDFG